MLFTAGTVLLCYSSLHTTVKVSVASLCPLLQGLLLSAYLKMLLADPNDAQLRQQISAVYERYSHFMDADLQQRAVEYQGLMKLPDVASRNVTAMPKWEKRKSLLLRRMAEKEVGLVDHVLQRWHASQGDQVSVLLFETVQCDWMPKRWVLSAMHCRAGRHLKGVKQVLTMLSETV